MRKGHLHFSLLSIIGTFGPEFLHRGLIITRSSRCVCSILETHPSTSSIFHILELLQRHSRFKILLYWPACS
ncbi:hypothetical protein VFPPC_17561 [Pochonia chlamydosporia 170]|uniref:Uncharacterized protein n=1 Tax=Pochonia chlamydosporia 170 TaxID=1380566 RepID=A0A219AR87_METCM|nr:hypothetical protein VFPPC_17561 [Pochonia chlamydosporia 170]OWT43276.1 hypothetical protein VFPPC_17561 [Pochonia chlamydosporia 170]